MTFLINKIIKWWRGPMDSEHFDNGYAYAMNQWKEEGDRALLELEAQAYGQRHPFDDGIREFIRVRELEIASGKIFIHPDRI